MIALIGLVFLSCLSHGDAVAQTSYEPQIQIDTSILESLNPSRRINPNAEYKATPLKRPSGSLNKPSLTRSYDAPATIPSTRDKDHQQRYQDSFQTQTTKRAPLPAAKPYIDPPASLKTAAVPPPVATEGVKQLSSQSAPLPKRRPATNKAPDSFVEEARQALNNKAVTKITAPKRVASAQIPRAPQPVKVEKQDGPAVKAMPKKAVDIDVMHVDKGPNNLNKQYIVNNQKADVINAIENITGEQIKTITPPTPKPEIVRVNPTPKSNSNRVESTRLEKSSNNDVANIDKPSRLDIDRAVKNALIKQDDTSVPETVSLQFGSYDAEDLDQTLELNLESNVLPTLLNNPSTYAHINSFASLKKGEVHSDKKKALVRALNIRSWLLQKGIESERLNVRALGKDKDKKKSNRVDIIFYQNEGPA